MTAPQPTPDHFARNAVDRDRARAQIARANAKALAETREQIGLNLEFLGGFRLGRWKWTVTVNGVGVAEGTAFTADRAKIRRYARYLIVLDLLAADGGEGGNRKRDIETSRVLNRFRSWVP